MTKPLANVNYFPEMPLKTTHTPVTLTQASLADLLAFNGQPCLSLCWPTHRSHPDNQQNPIRFHDLIKVLESSLREPHTPDAAKVLALSLGRVQLFEGDRNALAELALAADMPQKLTAVLGNDRTEPHASVSSYGGLGSGHMAMRHGQGGKKDIIDAEAERFFHAVNRTVLAHYSHPSKLP